MTAKNFETISLWIKQSEGGFVNLSSDPGGATNLGVTLRELSAWRHHTCTIVDIRALQWPEAQTIMHAQYWESVHGDDLPSGLDYCVMDAAYNSGVVQAVKWLQTSIGVASDGHLGIVTLDKIKSLASEKANVEAYDKARLGFMRALRTWPIFGKGWFARVNLVTSRALALAA
jgi:lysozyme family protein